MEINYMYSKCNIKGNENDVESIQSYAKYTKT